MRSPMNIGLGLGPRMRARQEWQSLTPAGRPQIIPASAPRLPPDNLGQGFAAIGKALKTYADAKKKTEKREMQQAAVENLLAQGGPQTEWLNPDLLKYEEASEAQKRAYSEEYWDHVNKREKNPIKFPHDEDKQKRWAELSAKDDPSDAEHRERRALRKEFWARGRAQFDARQPLAVPTEDSVQELRDRSAQGESLSDTTPYTGWVQPSWDRSASAFKPLPYYIDSSGNYHQFPRIYVGNDPIISEDALKRSRQRAAAAGGVPLGQLAKDAAIPTEIANLMRAYSEGGAPESALGLWGRAYPQIENRRIEAGDRARNRDNRLAIFNSLSEGDKTETLRQLAVVGGDAWQKAVSSIVNPERAKRQALANPRNGETRFVQIGSAQFNDLVGKGWIPQASLNWSADRRAYQDYVNMHNHQKASGQPMTYDEWLDKKTQQKISVAAAGAGEQPSGEHYQTELGKGLAKTNLEKIDRISEAANSAYDLRSRITQLKGLLRPSGSLESGRFRRFRLDLISGLSGLASVFGLDGPDLADVSAGEQFDNAVGQFVMSMVSQTKGSVSNKEMDLFAKWQPNLSNTVDGNNRILDYMLRMANQNINLATYLNDEVLGQGDQYSIPKNLMGIINKWKNDNPIFSSDEIDFNNEHYLKGGAGSDRLEEAREFGKLPPLDQVKDFSESDLNFWRGYATSNDFRQGPGGTLADRAEYEQRRDAFLLALKERWEELNRKEGDD